VFDGPKGGEKEKINVDLRLKVDEQPIQIEALDQEKETTDGSRVLTQGLRDEDSRRETPTDSSQSLYAEPTRNQLNVASLTPTENSTQGNFYENKDLLEIAKRGSSHEMAKVVMPTINNDQLVVVDSSSDLAGKEVSGHIVVDSDDDSESTGSKEGRWHFR
jgi:hypothetical protein